MGVIFSKSESSRFIGDIQTNLTSGLEVITDLKSGSAHLMRAVDGKTLSGAAYNAGKGLFGELIVPTIDRCGQAIEEMGQDLQTYISANNAVQAASTDTLDEDKLEQKIRESELYRNTTKMTADALSSQAFEILAMTNPVTAMVSLANQLFDIQGKLNSYVDSLDQDIEKMKLDLRLLQNFVSQTQGLFKGSLDKFKIAMQGVTSLSSLIVNSNGTYSFPQGMDRSWFTTPKKQSDYEYLALQQILSLEDSALNSLGLTQGQKDWYKRMKGFLKANPGKAYEVLYKDNTLWAMISAISKKYPSVADKFLDGMIGLEKMGSTKAAGFLKDAVSKFGELTSPVKYILDKKLGLGKALENAKIFNALGKGGTIVKFVGIAGTVFTFVGLALDGISGGISDGIKSKSIGKGIIGGTIDTVKSVGPLEGMTIGATIGAGTGGVVLPVVGAVPGVIIGGAAGLVVGGINWGLQTMFPHGVSDIKKTVFNAYDDGVKAIETVGKSTVQGLNTVKNVVGDFLKDPVKTWNKGSDLTDTISKFVPKFPKMPKIGFGW